MERVLPFRPAPVRVFTPAFVARLAEANRALRQLRALGCRVLSQTVGGDGARLVIDRNPHCRLAGCPHVSVTCGGRR